jgi:hypothetical protein
MPQPIATPYAQPQGVVPSFAGAQPGLYLPPAHRRMAGQSRPTPTDLLSGNGPIPWIDAFLAATPAAGVLALPDSPVSSEPPTFEPFRAPAASAFQKSPQASAEAAAQTLELLALRVRAGELPLTGYDPALGDAAALVSALAVLLGVRLAE